MSTIVSAVVSGHVVATTHAFQLSLTFAIGPIASWQSDADVYHRSSKLIATTWHDQSLLSAVDRARPLNRSSRPTAVTSAKAKTGQIPTFHAHQGTAAIQLAVSMGAGNEPPTEFRLFVSGWNDTEKGRFLFDADAAKATMSAYEQWGIDLAIDLEHQMLDPDIAADPTAKDARGWCNLELRPDGSLWAVNVTWTPDGAARLTEKRQRYVSPAFGYDTDSMRVTKILNVAITAMPATHNTPALIAASKGIARMSSTGLSPKLTTAALEAVAAKDQKGALDVLKQVLAALLGGDASADPSADPSAGDAPADPSTDPSASAAASVSAVAPGFGTGSNDRAELAVKMAELAQREKKLAADKLAFEAGERRTLVGSLVKIGVEIPATAWGDQAGTVPCARLNAEPLEDLRARVATLSASGVKPAVGAIKPPTSGGSDVAQLSADELRICSEMKCEPATFARLKAQRDSVKQTGGV